MSAKQSVQVEVATERTYSIRFDEAALVELCKAELIRQAAEQGVDLRGLAIEESTPCEYNPIYVRVWAKVQS